MKTTAIVCTLLAGSLGFGSLASAQDWNGRRDRGDDNRFEQRQDRREGRQDRRDERRDQQVYRQDRAYRNGYNAGAYAQPGYGYGQPAYVYSQPSYTYSQPSYTYNQPSYSYDQPRYVSQQRYSRGGYLPQEYRGRNYYVNDWHSHHGMYAPPSGYQWMNVDGNFLLVALASGLIANALLN